MSPNECKTCGTCPFMAVTMDDETVCLVRSGIGSKYRHVKRDDPACPHWISQEEWDKHRAEIRKEWEKK